jgi:hypothetical protein
MQATIKNSILPLVKTGLFRNLLAVFSPLPMLTAGLSVWRFV